jgi:hypothetical protein
MIDIKIINLFIISNNRYLYQTITKNKKEEWYIMNSNKLLIMNLYYYIIIDDNNTIIYLENSKYIIKFKIKYRNDKIKYIKLANKKCNNVKDKLLYSLLYDIYRMKKSNYIKK